MIFTQVSIADTHPPFHDDRAVELACMILQHIKPDRVVHHADSIDFYALSPFDRNPRRVARLQEELDTAYKVNRTLTSASPESDWRLLNDGNHELRLLRYQARHPEMFDLEVLRLENLLRLDQLNWRLVDPIEELDGTLTFVHGDRVSKHSAYAAKASMEQRWFQQSLLMGHTHRVGTYAIRGPNSARAAWEIGCLCTLKPEYRAHPNWIQGLAVITWSTTPEFSTFSVEQVIFSGTDRSRRCIFRGQEFVAR